MPASLREAEELADRQASYSPGLLAEARRLMTDLHLELEDEPASYEALALESVYTRYGTIAGPALNDSFHFGQTWWNDFGLPQGRGSNFISRSPCEPTMGASSSMAARSYNIVRAILLNHLQSISSSTRWIR